MRRTIWFSVLALCLSGMPREGLAQEPALIHAGVSAGGAGWAGIPLQFRPHPKLALDCGVYARAVQSDVFEPIWHVSPGLDASLSWFLSIRQKEDPRRTCYSGLYIRAGLARGDLDEEILGVGWVRERHPAGSLGFFQAQLGPAAVRRTETYMNMRYPPGHQEMTEGPWWSAMIHLRITWFFGLKR